MFVHSSRQIRLGPTSCYISIFDCFSSQNIAYVPPSPCVKLCCEFYKIPIAIYMYMHINRVKDFFSFFFSANLESLE